LVPENSRIRKVPLLPADGQFVSEMISKTVGHPKVTFAVLEINRVDLMRHGARPYLALFDALYEVAFRDVFPCVPAKTNQNSVE